VEATVLGNQRHKWTSNVLHVGNQRHHLHGPIRVRSTLWPTLWHVGESRHNHSLILHYDCPNRPPSFSSSCWTCSPRPIFPTIPSSPLYNNSSRRLATMYSMSTLLRYVYNNYMMLTEPDAVAQTIPPFLQELTTLNTNNFEFWLDFD
jgi:hypothetical protein